MKHEDDYISDFKFIRIDKSRPPLRWIANALGSLGTWAIVHAFKEQDSENNKISMIYAKISDPLLKFYAKYGTVYEMKSIEEEI